MFLLGNELNSTISCSSSGMHVTFPHATNPMINSITVLNDPECRYLKTMFVCSKNYKKYINKYIYKYIKIY